MANLIDEWQHEDRGNLLHDDRPSVGVTSQRTQKHYHIVHVGQCLKSMLITIYL
jgi:hypothetical protein